MLFYEKRVQSYNFFLIYLVISEKNRTFAVDFVEKVRFFLRIS